jgi:hypothetical protein
VALGHQAVEIHLRMEQLAIAHIPRAIAAAARPRFIVSSALHKAPASARTLT